MQGLRVGGFITRFDHECFSNNRRVLYMHRADLPFEPDKALAVAEFCDGEIIAIPGRFDELGCRFLRESRNCSEVIVMDELGRLEKDAQSFRQAVYDTLDRPVPVLGVIRQGFPGWTSDIADRPDVRVITVTGENRDALPELLACEIRL